MKILRSLAYLGYVAIFIQACSIKEDPLPQPYDTLTHFSHKPGVFILNEGIFQWGNGSIDFWIPGTKTVHHDIFQAVNKRPTGDVVQNMSIRGSRAWIVVNNSGKIEIVDLRTFKSVKTLTGFTSPRYLLFLKNQKVYASDLYRPVIYVMDTLGNKLKEINLERTAEQLLEVNGIVWALNWSAFGGYDNSGISLIHSANDTYIGYIELGKEPNSAVIDRAGFIWVLCSGGYMHQQAPTLWKMDSKGNILFRMEFDRPGDYPTHLQINKAGDTLFYLNRDVYALPVINPALPGKKIIEAGGRNFYGFKVGKHFLMISDALNYQTRGKVYIFTRGGKSLDTLTAGIIPGHFCSNE